MDRRALLAAAGSLAIAGCIGGDGPATAPECPAPDDDQHDLDPDDPPEAFSVTLERLAYALSTTERDDEPASVIDLADLPASVHAPLRRATRSVDDTYHERDDVLRQAIACREAVRVDGSAYEISLTTIDHDERALKVTAEDHRRDDVVGEVTLLLRNAGSDPITVVTTAPGPLGVLTAFPSDEPVERPDDGLLWTGVYEASDAVSLDPEFGTRRDELRFELAPGEVRAAVYRLHRQAPHPGIDDAWGFDAGVYVVEAVPQFVRRGEAPSPDNRRPAPFRLRLSVPPA